MISLIPTSKEMIRMEIKMHLPHETIFTFLQKRGFLLKPFLHQYEDTSFPNGTTKGESLTWTATKPGTEPAEEHRFLKVFETELKEVLNGLEELPAKQMLEERGFSFETGV